MTRYYNIEDVVEEERNNQGIELLLEDNRGVWIPYDFAREFDHSKFTGYSRDEVNELIWIGEMKDPTPEKQEQYWEIWDNILLHAQHVDQEGYKWYLEQDMNLFLVKIV